MNAIIPNSYLLFIIITFYNIDFSSKFKWYFLYNVLVTIDNKISSWLFYYILLHFVLNK